MGGRISLLCGLLLASALVCFDASAENASSPGSQPIDDNLSLIFSEDELFISATQSARTLGKAPAIATVISDKQLKHMGARNLLDALKIVPGFGVSYPSEFAIENSIEVRGIKTAESEKILLMIDGHRMNVPYAGSWPMMFDDFPIEQVKRIEVIRGPGSALYGANAFVAAINIIMKKPADTEGTTLLAGGGNYQQAHGQLAYGNGGGAVGIAGFYDWMQTDGTQRFVAADAAGQSGRTNYWRNNQTAYLTTDFNKFSVTGAYLKKHRGTPLSIVNTIDRLTELQLRQTYGELGYKDRIGGVDLDAKLGIDQFWWDVLWQINSGGINTGHPLATNRTLSGSLQLQFEPMRGHFVTAGLSHENVRQFDVRHIVNGIDVSATFNHNQDAKRNVTAVYLQDEWDLSKFISLTAGVRFDHYSDFGNTTNPRLALVWSLTDRLDLKLLYGRAFRAPSFLEMYEKNNAVAVGNPNLMPEIMQTFEGGIAWKLGYNYELNANLFHNRFTDRITRQFPISTNSGGATIWGVEAEFKADWQEHLYGYLNYSYQRSRDHQTGTVLPDVPAHRVRIGFNAGLFDDLLNVNAGLRWDGKRPRTAGDPRAVTPANTVVDMAVSTEKLMDGLTLTFKAHNLFDSNIYDPSPTTVPGGYPRPGREIVAEAAYTF